MTIIVMRATIKRQLTAVLEREGDGPWLYARTFISPAREKLQPTNQDFQKSLELFLSQLEEGIPVRLRGEVSVTRA